MTEKRCFACGRSEADGATITEDCWDVAYICSIEDRETCVSTWAYHVRQREYAELTSEVLDRLENEADKEDHDCEMYGAREISGPELLSLIRIARRWVKEQSKKPLPPDNGGYVGDLV